MNPTARNASVILRNPESLQLIGCRAMPLVGMDLLDKKDHFLKGRLCYTDYHALGTVQPPGVVRKRAFHRVHHDGETRSRVVGKFKSIGENLAGCKWRE